MERYLLRSSQTPGPRSDSECAEEKSKMAPGPSVKRGETLQQQQVVDAQEMSEETGAAERGMPSPPTSPPQQGLDYKLLAIEVASRIAPDLQTALEQTVQSSLLKLQADITAHDARILELEQRVSGLEDENSTLTTKLGAMSSTMTQVTEKLEDLENRSRRNNWRLVGLSEAVSQAELQTICETELPRALGIQRSCRVERAHRTGRSDAAQGRSGKDSNRPPRQVIMRFLDYNDKVDLLREFRKRKDPLKIRGDKVLMFERFFSGGGKKTEIL